MALILSFLSVIGPIVVQFDRLFKSVNLANESRDSPLANKYRTNTESLRVNVIKVKSKIKKC